MYSEQRPRRSGQNFAGRSGRTTSAVVVALVVILLFSNPARAAGSPRVTYVPVGSGPADAIFDPYTGGVFILNLFDNTATILNGWTNAVVGTVPAGNGPDVGAFDPRNGDIYVTDANTNQVAVLAGSTGATVATISVAPSILPQGIAFDYRNGYLYTANSGTYPNPTYQNSNTVSVIDGRTNSLVTTIPDTFAPLGQSFLIYAAYDAQNGNIYVSDEGHGIQVLNPQTETFVADIVTSSNYVVTYDPLNGVVYALGYPAAPGLPSTIGVINTATNAVQQTISLPANCQIPGSGVVDLWTGLLYVACMGTPNTVAVLDPVSNTIVKDISVGGVALYTVVDDFDFWTNSIYVPVMTTNSVAVISP
jgi:DNA-binding beta-propeller fold protein YncE